MLPGPELESNPEPLQTGAALSLDLCGQLTQKPFFRCFKDGLKMVWV